MNKKNTLISRCRVRKKMLRYKSEIIIFFPLIRILSTFFFSFLSRGE